jgi:hypothetical protein
LKTGCKIFSIYIVKKYTRRCIGPSLSIKRVVIILFPDGDTQKGGGWALFTTACFLDLHCNT